MTQSIDVEEFRAVLDEAIKETYAPLFNVEVQTPPSFGFQGIIKHEPQEIAAYIDLAGAIQAVLLVKGSQKYINNLLALMMGMADLSEADMQDGIKELANILAGGLKSYMSKKSIKFDIGLPENLDAQNNQIGHEDTRWIFIQVIIDTARLDVYLTLE